MGSASLAKCPCLCQTVKHEGIAQKGVDNIISQWSLQEENLWRFASRLSLMGKCTML